LILAGSAIKLLGIDQALIGLLAGVVK